MLSHVYAVMLSHFFLNSVFLSFSMSPDSSLNPLGSLIIGKLGGQLELCGGGRQTSVSPSAEQKATASASPFHLALLAGQTAAVYPQGTQLVLGAGSALARVASQWSCGLGTWGAESTVGVFNDWEEFRTSKGALRCKGVRMIRRCPMKNRLSFYCSKIARSQDVVKYCFC